MTDAIQKAREALTAAQDAMSDAENFWGLDFDAALRKIDTALAALDAETPATPADVGEEPAAWEGYWPGAGSISSETRLTRYLNKAEEWKHEGAEIEPLYSATALERVVRERDEARARLLTAYQVKAEMNDLANAERHARLAAEAKLAEARKVIEPFAEFGRNNTDDEGWSGLRCERERIVDWFGPSEFRAARRFLEETK